MIRKILVYENALADSHPALERAIQLSRYHKLNLKVVDVDGRPEDDLHRLHHSMRSFVEREKKERLEQTCDQFRRADIEIQTEVLRGRPFVAIVREVVNGGFQLLIKAVASHRPTPILGKMGAVDLRLVRNCPCPVWLEVPNQKAASGRILVAIDPHSENDLNTTLLEIANSLVKARNGELHVVAAWTIRDEEFLAAKMNPEKLAMYVQDVQTAAQTNLNDILERAGVAGESDRVYFQKGRPARIILESVENLSPDVLVIGTVEDTTVQSLLIGDTADTVLRQIDCSVLAVKPESLFRA